MISNGDISERLSELIRELKTDQAGLARLAGVTKQAAGKWFSGASKPTWEALANLKKNTNVSDLWIMRGKGPKFLGSESFEAKEAAVAYGSPFEAQILEDFRKLNNQRQTAVIDFIKLMGELI